MSLLGKTLKVMAIIVAVPVAVALLLFLDGMPLRPVVIWPGTYTGTVTDASTGKPIEGAAVYMSWDREYGLNPVQRIIDFESSSYPLYVGESLVFTDREGRFKAPARFVVEWMPVRVGRWTDQMMVYKRDYVAYSNGGTFLGKGADYDEPKERVEKETEIALRPWQMEYDHQAHFRFLVEFYRQIDRQMFERLLDLTAWEDHVE